MSSEVLNKDVVIEQAGAQYHLTRGEDGAPLVKDLELARWLGFERSRKIRELINRWSAELGHVSPYRGAKPSGPEGGRPEEGYLLTEQQALFIAAKSETPRATEILKQIIAVFVAVRQGVAEHKTPAALPPGWSMRKLADIMDKVEQLREALDDYPVATVSSAEEVARLAGICRTTFFKALRAYPELRSNKRGGAWLVHRTLLDLERRGIITLPDRSHITGTEMELAIVHRDTESLTEEELEEVGSESVWQVCECHRIDAIDKAILSAIMTYKGKAGVMAITRALGFRAERNMQERLRALRAAGYLSVMDNGPGRTKVYTVEQRTLLGHTEHCTVSPRAKKSDKVVSLIEWSGP